MTFGYEVHRAAGHYGTRAPAQTHLLSEDARRAVLASATAESQRLGDRRIGTHHLPLALLHDPIAPTIGILGVDLAAARRVLTELDHAENTTGSGY